MKITVGSDHGAVALKEEVKMVLKELGVEVVYQEFNQMPSLSVAENIYLTESKGKRVLANQKEFNKWKDFWRNLFRRKKRMSLEELQKARPAGEEEKKKIEISPGWPGHRLRPCRGDCAGLGQRRIPGGPPRTPGEQNHGLAG